MKINIINFLKVIFYFRWIGFQLSENYAFEIYYFHKVRSFLDGLSLIEGSISLDLKGDHTPRFHIFLMFFNYTIIEINIFNINHQENYE